MIKVLFLIHDLGQGGAEKVLINLVNNMNTTKFDVTVMTLFDIGVNKQFLSQNIKYKTWFHKAIRGNSYLMKLFTPNQLHKMIIKEHYDIEVSYLEGPCARVISGCSYEDTKLVSWIHIEQKSKENACKSFRNYKESLNCYQKFDRTICVSETVKDDFCFLYKLDNPVDVFYNTNETDEIKKLSKDKINPNFNKNEINIIGVGKILKNKGFDRLAIITKKLLEDGLLVHTYILGVGPLKEDIEKYILKNKINDSFTFLGYQTNPYKYLAKADLFVCASYAEGFSTAATEALIVGTPVITTRVSGMEEMLGKNNEYGIITENDEESLYLGIKDLICNKEKLKHYKEKAQERGKYFSKDKTVKAVEDMLIDLMNDGEAYG